MFVELTTYMVRKSGGFTSPPARNFNFHISDMKLIRKQWMMSSFCLPDGCVIYRPETVTLTCSSGWCMEPISFFAISICDMRRCFRYQSWMCQVFLRKCLLCSSSFKIKFKAVLEVLNIRVQRDTAISTLHKK